MRHKTNATLVLAIGDYPMVEIQADLEIDVTSECRLVSVLVFPLTGGPVLRIEREGIYEASNVWLQSPLAKAYWTAGQAYVDQHRARLLKDHAFKPRRRHLELVS